MLRRAALYPTELRAPLGFFRSPNLVSQQCHNSRPIMVSIRRRKDRYQDQKQPFHPASLFLLQKPTKIQIFKIFFNVRTTTISVSPWRNRHLLELRFQTSCVATYDARRLFLHEDKTALLRVQEFSYRSRGGCNGLPKYLLCSYRDDHGRSW